MTTELSVNSVPKIGLSSSEIAGSFPQVLYNFVDKIQMY